MKQDLRLLIMDDDVHFRTALRGYLAEIPDFQAEIEEASTLAEGVSALLTRKFDLVLTHIKLPNGEGISILERLLSLRPLPPVVILMGAPSEEDALRCLAHGAQGYVPKEQINPTTLRRVILHAMARWEGIQKLIVERARVISAQIPGAS